MRHVEVTAISPSVEFHTELDGESLQTVLEVMQFNQSIRDQTGNDEHLLTLEEVLTYWDQIPQRDSTIAPTSSFLVFPQKLKEGFERSLRIALKRQRGVFLFNNPELYSNTTHIFLHGKALPFSDYEEKEDGYILRGGIFLRTPLKKGIQLIYRANNELAAGNANFPLGMIKQTIRDPEKAYLDFLISMRFDCFADRLEELAPELPRILEAQENVVYTRGPLDTRCEYFGECIPSRYDRSKCIGGKNKCPSYFRNNQHKKDFYKK